MGKVKPKYVESTAIGDLLVGIVDQRGKHISSVIPVGETGSVLVSNGVTPEWSTASITMGDPDNLFGSSSGDRYKK